MHRPEPPPEAVLIRIAREAASLSISEAAADAAGISLSAGHRSRTATKPAAEYRPIRGIDTYIAHMAHVVGISPERLEQYRPDAALVLREIVAGMATRRRGHQ